MVDVSATQADWSREKIRFGEWCPSRRLIRAIRKHQYWKTRGWWARPIRAFWGLQARLWNTVCGSDIPGARRSAED